MLRRVRIFSPRRCWRAELDFLDLVAVDQQQAFQPVEDVAAEVQPDVVGELPPVDAELEAAVLARCAEPAAELDPVAVLVGRAAGFVVLVLHGQEVAEQELLGVDPLARRDAGLPVWTEFNDEAGLGL